MLLSAATSQLLVVDVQERLMPAISDCGRVLARIGLLLASAHRLGVPALATEQYPKGLGPTLEEIAAALPPGSEIVEKMAFAAPGEARVAEVIAARRAAGRGQVVVCGVEAHVCVLQSALVLREMGYAVFVVGDAVSSRSPESVSAARTRLTQAGCAWVTAEMVAFEWLARAGTEDFRALARLLRDHA